MSTYSTDIIPFDESEFNVLMKLSLTSLILNKMGKILRKIRRKQIMDDIKKEY